MFFQQRQLPHWARRTNPHVWRHLSRTSAGDSIDLSRLRRVFLISTGVALALPVIGHLVTLSASTPLSALLSSPIIIVTYTWLLGTLIGLPIAIALYGIILVRVGTHAASLMLRERASDGLDVLRTVPAPLHDILLSQVAACIWHEIAHLDTLLWVAAWMALPPVLVTHATLWFAATPIPVPQITIVAGLLVTLARPWLELVMAGAIGTLTGTIARHRISARVSSALLLTSYFVLVNLPRLLSLSMVMRLWVEIALPLLLPILITRLALSTTARILTAD